MTRVPRLVEGVEIKKLRLTPSQGYILSLVNGQSSEQAIATTTGIPPSLVSEAIDKLVEMGAIRFGDPPKEKTKVKERADVQEGNVALGGVAAAGNAEPLFRPEELAEECDIDEAKKKQILNAYYLLDRLNYYELFGLHQLVDKKEIKSAYYQIAPDFHPDKFFRKNLGSFKAKTEIIFGRLTDAHDTLTKSRLRAEYDEYLTTAEANRKAAELQDIASELSRAQAAAEAEARSAVQPSQAPPGVDPSEANKRQLALRREAFARKLRGGSLRPPPVSAAPSTPPIDPKAAAEALRVRYEAAIIDAKRRQVAKYLTSARESHTAKDWAAVTNFYRLAMHLAPRDEAVQNEGNVAIQEAAASLADGFMRQAEFESNQERWPEAASSFLKVCAGRPDDAKAHDRAAFAMMKSGRDNRQAVDLARRAVELAPKQAVYRITLANVYKASDLAKSAEAELERASELAAGEPKLLEMVKHARDQWGSGGGDGAEKKGLFASFSRSSQKPPASEE